MRYLHKVYLQKRGVMTERNLHKYEKDYEDLPFEPILISYRRKIVIENLYKYNHSNILEIGCGLEPIFNYFTDFSSMTVVEPSNLFYRNACKIKDLHKKKNIIIYNELLENISDELKSNNYSFIIISCLLHELLAPEEFLKDIYKLCSSGTVVHINVPNAESFHRILAVKSGIIDNIFSISETQVKMQQCSVFNQQSLINLLTRNKFTIIDSGSYFIKPFTHSQMQSLLDNQIINQKILDGLFKMNEILPGLGAEIFVNAKIV